MSFAEIQVKKLNNNAILPTRGHATDAGMDLYALDDVFLSPGQGAMARTGIAMAIPNGYVGMVADRSSLAKKGIKTAGGIIDSGYRGEIQIILRNLTHQELVIKAGERMAQLLLIPVATPQAFEVLELDSTARGEGGFGSTGA